MPHGEEHRRQRGKNIALLLILAALCAFFFLLTVLKLGGA